LISTCISDFPWRMLVPVKDIIDHEVPALKVAQKQARAAAN
jgi:hypothetical protein